MNTNRLPRLIHLEAMRGIAALIVVAHHFLLGFTPVTSGYLAEYRTEESFAGSAFFAFINGTGAVFFFFVMSGYVLTHHYLLTGNKQIIMQGILKRLPRLFFPVFLSCLCAYLLFKFNLFYFEQAGALSGSWWLRSLGFGKISANFEPNLLKVTSESLAVFFNGVNHYNSALWTMKPELIGSILSMGMAYLLKDLFHLKHALYLCTLLFLASVRLDPHLYPFLLGLYIAVIQAKYPLLRLPKIVSWLIFSLGIYLLGYLTPLNTYAWMGKFANDSEHFRDHIYSIGGSLILFAAVFCREGYEYLSGKTGRILGSISFPIYLIHTLIIGSISSYIYTKYHGLLNKNTLIEVLAVATFSTAIVTALIFSKMDDAWVNWINNQVKRYSARAHPGELASQKHLKC